MTLLTVAELWEHAWYTNILVRLHRFGEALFSLQVHFHYFGGRLVCGWLYFVGVSVVLVVALVSGGLTLPRTSTCRGIRHVFGN